MCRNKGYTPEKEVHLSRWGLDNNADPSDAFYATSYMQAAGSGGLPIIARDTIENRNVSQDGNWGIVPFWEKSFEEGRKKSGKYVNVRAETVEESKLYASLLKKKQRCLIPCSFYYEHHHFEEGKIKVPFLVEVRHQPIFSIPALYSIYWKDKERKEGIISYSMFTIVATKLLAAIHNGGENSHRMPLVIHKEMEGDWLNPSTSDKVIQEILNYQIDSSHLKAHAVAPLTGKKAKLDKAITEEEENWGKYNDEIKKIEELAA